MKKKLFSIILATILMVSMVGCNSSKPENTVDTFLKSAQKFDIEKMQESMDPELQGDTSELEELESDEATKMYLDYFKKNAAKMTYKITNSTIDGDNAVVTVDFKYVDGTDALKSAISKLFEEAFTQAFSGTEMSDEEMEKLIYETLNNYESENGEKFTTSTIELKCIKSDNKWYIEDVEDDFLNVIFSNYFSYLENLDDAFGDFE